MSQHVKHLCPGGGGMGLSVTEGGRTHVTYSAEGVFFKTSAFCKRRILFCTQVRSMGGGGENLLIIHKISAALTQSDS